MDEQYSKARKKLQQKVIKRFDGCADGKSSDDWITDCADQDTVYPVANLLRKTLDQILGYRPSASGLNNCGSRPWKSEEHSISPEQQLIRMEEQ